MTRDQAAWLEILRRYRAGGKDWKAYNWYTTPIKIPEHFKVVVSTATIRPEVFAEYFRSEGHRRRMKYARLKMALRRFWRALKG